MSLFPIRLKPGGTITVHLRLQVSIPLWVDRKDYLVYPNGEKVLRQRRGLQQIETLGNGQSLPLRHTTILGIAPAIGQGAKAIGSSSTAIGNGAGIRR